MTLNPGLLTKSVFVLSILVIAGIALQGTVPAFAALGINLSATSGPVGTSEVVSGHGFASNSLVTIKYGSTVETTVTTNGGGSFTANAFLIPSSTAGSHTITATDASSNSASTTFTVQNSAPVANNQSVNANENTPTAVTLTATDQNGDPLTYTVTVAPVHGVLSGTAPNLTFTPTSNYHGSDSFKFRANDGSANSNTATVSITVIDNSVPSASPQSASTNENAPLLITPAASDSDADALSYAIQNSPLHGTAVLNANGTFTYTPASNYHGQDNFNFTASDGTNTSPSARVDLTVAAQSSRPTSLSISLNTLSVPWGQPVSIKGVLLDATSSVGIGKATITFNGTGASGLPLSVVTASNGSFVAVGTSPNTVGSGWTIQAHFAGNTTFAEKYSSILSYSTTKHLRYCRLTASAMLFKEQTLQQLES